MTIIAEQKSQLAKLMATENLTIEHQKISTAKFDPKNRILYLPIWQNMNGTMYDLLCGHEVGHALYTPADGWHDVASDESKGKGYKNFLNVVEDARIEKKVKRRYPGLKVSFQNAYQELMRRDFFGVNGRDINEMSFIDRLNLFSKSQYTATWIEFSAQEEVYVRRIQDLETWEDVLKLTDEIYEYSKHEQFEMQNNDFEQFAQPSGEDSDDDLDDFEEVESDDAEDGDDGVEQKSSQKKDEDENGEEDDDLYGVNRDKESSPSTEDQFEPFCETDETHRRNETKLLDEKSKGYLYVDMPKPIMENIVTPAKRVHELYSKELKEMMNDGYFSESDLTKWVNEFKNKNEKYVGLLAKEFEMRKAAKAFSKSKLCDTGDIDINKLSTYKFDDNIFRKMMLVPKGKKHGLILLLDKSGSMSNNMAGSIEQILVLTMFCRKVNIPFIVYGFGDAQSLYLMDKNIVGEYSDAGKELLTQRCFTDNIGEIEMGTVRLREYVNSKMSNAEYTKAIRNLILVKRTYEKKDTYSDRMKLPRLYADALSNTPLTQALVATAEIMKKFRKENNLDITNLVIVHDGDADGVHCHHDEKEGYHTDIDGITRPMMHNVRKNMDTFSNIVCVRDSKNKFERKLITTSHMNDIILEWFAKTTHSKVFGFFITDSNAAVKNAIGRYYSDENKVPLHMKRYQSWHEHQEQIKTLHKKFRSEKYLACNTKFYEDFYIISGGNDLKTEDEEIEIEGKVTAAKLKTAFMKFNKKRAINRVLVSKFIQGIAA